MRFFLLMGLYIKMTCKNLSETKCLLDEKALLCYHLIV